ncbi:CPBP family intramembrane glutamic endopeptidase [Defluviimonas sp. SAOS-178_SWC]|uniref:CPBP family intramembrane glutamic endopeptidase n=1 Tax=Defluviimonas sp. SAOS-178_SWC TaxID=3121287 RepID=UPI0032220AF6
MGNTPTFSNDAERFNWLERPDDDFPFYRGQPVWLSTGAWLLVLLAVALGFLELLYGPGLVSAGPARFVVVFLYVAMPLAVLSLVAGQHWRALFRPIRAIDFLWMIGFAILNLLVTLVTGTIMTRLIETTANKAVAGASQLAGSDLLLFFAQTGVQLVGEEVMSILPFLALMYWLCGRGGMRRKRAIIVAALIVAALFAVEHLPTYNWNLLQALLGVGVARIVLLLPYIMTKSLAVSAGAHILNDWMFFGVSILGSAMAATK